MATCTKCGKLNYEGVKFCTACGTPLNSSTDYSYQDDEISDGQPETFDETVKAKPTQPVSRVEKSFDKRIIYVGVGVILLIGLVLLLRYLASNQSLNVEFTYTEGVLMEGDSVIFTTQTEGETFEWDFGDSTAREYGKRISHVFQNANTYRVTLYVNGKYSTYKDILITPVVFDDEPVDTRPIEATIQGPPVVEVGQLCVFEDLTPGDSAREWHFADKEGVFSRDKKVSYTFKKPFSGGYKITLYSKGAQNQKTMTVIVNPQKRNDPPNPGGGKENKIRKPALSEDAVKILFQELLDGKKNLPDVMKALKAITGDDSTIKVSETGTKNKESQLIGFVKSLSARASGNTKWSVVSVKYDFNPETGYIKSLLANLKELK